MGFFKFGQKNKNIDDIELNKDIAEFNSLFDNISFDDMDSEDSEIGIYESLSDDQKPVLPSVPIPHDRDKANGACESVNVTSVELSKEKIPAFSSVHIRNSDTETIEPETSGAISSYETRDKKRLKEASDLKSNSEFNIAVVWNNKGVALSRLGLYSESIEAYDQALLLNPDYPGAWNNKGVVLAKLGRYTESIEAFEQALILDCDFSSAWNNKGVALRRLGKYYEAIEAYDHALLVNKQHSASYEQHIISKPGILTPI